MRSANMYATSSYLTTALLIVAFVATSSRVQADADLPEGFTEPASVVKVLTDGKTKLTPTLVAWISQQSEAIVEELESIARYNSETSKFSVVSYLRYLTLFDHLKVVASKPTDEFKWIARKANTFARIYDSAMQIVFNFLQDVDKTLREIEDKEPKSKQVDPSKDWTKNYETIRFIALHVSIPP